MILNKEIDEKVVNTLAKKYSALKYYSQLSSLVNSAFPSENFDCFSKYELHKLLNDTIIQNYNGEELHKYKLFQSFINKKNIIAAFEIQVNNSRVDFLTINGHTTSYEIKSELDNLYKLRKQMADYLMAFEYNYLVIDEKHIKKAEKLLPEGFGLWSYKDGKYRKLRKALLNNRIEPEVQLRLLTKMELVNSFPEFGGEIQSILNSLAAKNINSQFKKALKRGIAVDGSF